jgi:alpha-beta hydrolase superfamily lysophospholipase
MKHFEDEFQSNDGVRFFLQGWTPDTDPKAVVCLVHGLGEHCGRYVHVAQALTDAGYALLAFDLRGHGRTTGKRGHFPNPQVLLEDIDRLLQAAEQRFPGLPRFLYGHSMGGILVLYYTTARKPALAGVVATSPGLRTALEEQRLKVALSRTLGAILPEMSLPTGLSAEQISRDPAVVQKYREDPMVHGVATLGLATSLLKAIHAAFDQADQFCAPLLLMHGGQDSIAYARGSQEYAALAPNATLKLWEGLYHETHNEPEKEQVLAYMIQWLDARLNTWLNAESPLDKHGASWQNSA